PSKYFGRQGNERAAGDGGPRAGRPRSSVRFGVRRIVFTAWLPRLFLCCAVLRRTSDAHFVTGRKRIRGAVDQPVGELEALNDLDLGSEIAPELDRFERNRVVRADRGDFHSVLTEDQRAGRNADDIGVAWQLEIDLRVGARLQLPVGIIGMQL